MLSDWEQEQLALIERNLYADRRFAKAARPMEQKRAKAVVIMLITALLGMAVVITGVVIDSALVGLLGFVTMLGGSVISLRQPPVPTLVPEDDH